MLKAGFGIRGRVLAIALVPSFALLAAGVGVSYYLVEQGVHTKDWVSDVDQSTNLGVVFTRAVEQERRLSLLELAGDHQVGAEMIAVRKQVDQAFQAGTAKNSLEPLDPGLSERMMITGAPLAARWPTMRQQVDAGTASPTDTFTLGSQMIAFALSGMDLIARTAPDATTSVEESKARSTFNAVEAFSRSVALSTPAMVHGWLTAAQLPQFGTEVGSFRSGVDNLTTQLSGPRLAQLQAIIASPAWKRLNVIDDAIMRHGAGQSESSNDSSESMSSSNVTLGNVALWKSDADQVNQQLLDLYHDQQTHALALASASGDRISRNSILGGGGVLVVSVAAFAVALWLSDRLIRRLKRLRGETLKLADEQLPEIMAKLRAGEQVDVDTAVANLDYGKDEIGQVGAAFNRAQRAAVAAAVTEAQTREGVKAVFLNIAHRSQVVVHKQLEILDRAEYDTEDPRQLDMLFQLDHLATRERRNAENLIILGGEQPGRQWHTPVPLVELVRSSVAETEDYARVHDVRLPELHLVGAVVADLVHLLAELVDNATSFSPPESRVDITGNVVGRGVVVEIADQGLGMNAVELARVNETLRNPPDFSVETLSSDSRLGLFVVGRLAVRNGISVRLVESDYGGVKAIVIIPSSLIAADRTNPEPDEPDMYAPAVDRGLARHRVRLPDEPPTYGPVVAVADQPLPPADEPAPAAPAAPPAPAPQPTVARYDADSGGGRPSLPRRTRQAHLSPQLVLAEPAPAQESSESARPRSPEQARDLFSAIESGTRRGRTDETDNEGGYSYNYGYNDEGFGEGGPHQ